MTVLEDIAREESKLEMTPMIDVTFLLLVFFMCTIRFKSLEGKLSAHLPKDAGVQERPAEQIEKVEIRLLVLDAGRRVDPHSGAPWSGEGRFAFSGRVVEYRVGPRRTTDPAELRARLEQLHRVDPERPATIAPAPGAVYADVVGALDAAVAAGFREIAFAGARK